MSNGGVLDIVHLEEMVNDLDQLPVGSKREAKLNLLKYLQIAAVKAYERKYDTLYFNLRSDERGFEELRHAVREKVPPKGELLQQPLEMASLDEYLQHAKIAKVTLDNLVHGVASEGTTANQGAHGLEVVEALVKSPESTQRKADKSCGGKVRQVTDMARVTIVCNTVQALSYACKRLTKHAQVRNVSCSPMGSAE